MTKNLSYGLYSKREKKLLSDFESDDFSKNYRYMDSKEILKVGGGVCWDKTRFAMEQLKKMEIEAEEYFCKLELGPDFPSHSFILIPVEKGKYRLFECSWFDYYGLHKPMSKQDIFKMVHKWFVKKYPKSKDFICWRMKV